MSNPIVHVLNDIETRITQYHNLSEKVQSVVELYKQLTGREPKKEDIEVDYSEGTVTIVKHFSQILNEEQQNIVVRVGQKVRDFLGFSRWDCYIIVTTKKVETNISMDERDKVLNVDAKDYSEGTWKYYFLIADKETARAYLLFEFWTEQDC